MFSALFYLQYHSFKNRLLLRLRRLKQPKYLVGALVGALYVYFYFFRYLLGGPSRHSRLAVGVSPSHVVLYEGFGAAILFVVLALAWVLPNSRAALAFSEAEVAFLFPAPISRTGLIQYKLLRSQPAILFSTFILVLVNNRFGGRFWTHAAGWWLILSTMNLHILGASFARTMLLDRGISNWQRRLVILGLVALAGMGAILWARQSLPPPDFSHFGDLKAVLDYVQQLLVSGPIPWLLYPFRLVVRPYLAPDGLTFLSAAVPALVLLALHYAWVVRSDVAFEEASVEVSRKISERIAAARAGNWRGANGRLKVSRSPFVLRPSGPPAVALLWKNLISAGQAFTPRLWLMLAAAGAAACALLGQSSGIQDLVSAIGMVVGMFVVWSLFIGPQILRQDFRQDLPLADILKMYPIRGWEVALGELLAPAAILTGIQWLLLIISGALLGYAPVPKLGRFGTLGIGLGAALVLPMLNLIILQIPNAAVLLFPAWVQTGKERAHGIEVTGQRIIAIFSQLLVFVLSLIPAATAFTLVFFLATLVFSPALAILPASLAAALVLAAEGFLGVVLLGRLFERLDISSEPPT